MGLYSLYFYSMFMLFYSKWTWEEIEMMEATRLHPVVRRVFAPSESKRNRKVLDAVMEVSEQYLKDHPENHENALPYSMAVSEYSGTVMSVRVYSGHYEKLVNILRQYPCTEIVGIEVDPTNEAYYIVKLGGKATVKDGIYTDETGDFGAIMNDIYKAKLITSTKIKMSSRPEIRMVSKSRAYNRDYFYYQQVIMYAGIRKKDGKPFESVKYNVDRMDEGSTVRMLNVHQGKTLLQTKSGGSRYFEKGSDFFMTIQINARDKAMMPHADQMLKRVYVMRNKTFDNGIAVGYEVMTGEGLKVRFFGQRSRWIKNPVTGKREEHIRPDASMENIQKGIDKGSVQVYEPFFESPSMTRTQTILYVNVTKRSREELIAMVNRGSCGAFEIMQTAYYKQQLPAEKAMKKISRLSLMMTGSAKFGIMKNFAWFQGDLKAFGSVFHDGQGFISAEFVQAVLKAMGFDLSLRECAKFCNQGRFGAVKGFNLVDLRKVMRKIMDSLIERGIAKGYVKVDPTMVQATDIEKNPKIEALGCGKYDGYILYCGNLDEIDYFGDSTNVKCMFDLSQELEYCLMDIPVAPKGHAVTSRQICNVMQFMKNFVPVFTKLGQNTIDHILTKKMGDTDVLDDSWEYDETSKDISNSTFASDVLSAIIPNIDQMDASIRRVQYKGMIDAMNKTCNRFNFRVKGGNFKIVGDLAGWFGARLLNFDEMYSPTIKSSNGLVYAVAFRHPLCGRGEHLPVKFVDKKELFSRIDILKREDGSNVPEDEKEALRLMIEFIMPGICMIGSTYEFVAAYFSGADFDGDSITLIWEEALVEAALDLPLYYVLYGGHNASAEEFQFGYDLIPGSFRYQYGIGGGTVNPSIGTLAGYNVTVLGMLNRVIKDETGKVAIYVRNMFRPEVKDFIWKVVKGDYKRKYKGNVNFEGFEATYAEDFIKAVATCGNTRKEVIDMLKDLNVIISKCMNDVIDAAKTGDKVIVPFLETIQSRIRSGAVAVDDYGKISMVNGSSSELKPLIYSIRGAEGEIEKGSEYYKYFNCPLKMDETDPEHPVLVFEDELTELRNNVLEYAHKKLTSSLQVGVTDVFGTYQSQDEYLHNTLTFLSTQFADIMDRNVGDRKTMKLALAAMTRNIMRKHSRLSMDSLIYEVRAASWYTNKKTGKAESNSYYLSFVPELAKFYVDRFCPDKVFTNRVYKFKGGHAEFGQEITFVDGFSKETGFYAESPINGTFRLELSREGNPVVRQSVRDMIPSVEEDENCVLIELKNDHLSGEVLLDEIEKERANGSIFKIEYAIGDKVVYSYKDNKGAYLHLTANGKPLAGIRVPSGKAYYQYHLWNKQIDIDLTEMGTRGGDDGKMDIVYLVGHLCTAAKKVNSDPTALTNLAA